MPAENCMSSVRPEENKRLAEIGSDYLEKLKQLDFDAMSVYGKVDYILLKKEIVYDLGAIKLEEDKYNKITTYIPFAEDIYLLERKRRRGATMDGQQIAAELNVLLKQVKSSATDFQKVTTLNMDLATTCRDAVIGLKGRLKNFYSFYQGYDPQFTWWVPVPYARLDTALDRYAALIYSKGKINTTQKPDSSGIKGVPIGREELIRQLKAEMIPYTPEELIKLANKEFAWCDKEMLKASAEMGYENRLEKSTGKSEK